MKVIENPDKTLRGLEAERQKDQSVSSGTLQSGEVWEPLQGPS